VIRNRAANAGKALGAARGEMPLLEHLAELRKRLFICVIAVFIGAIAGFFCWNWLLHVATKPYCQAQVSRHIQGINGASPCQLYISDPLSLITTRTTIGIYIGIFFASPIILWQLWRFITPGLEKKEKRYAIPFVISSLVLFVMGAYIAWLTFPMAMKFFLSVGGAHITTIFNPQPYLKLILVMMLVFGIAFEAPLLLVFLQLARVITSKQLRSWRRMAIVINFIVAAVGTPSQDPYSLLALAIPMCLLYEVAIIVGRVMKR
jgi:sec-independent protein translocase protein TatC